MPALNFKIQFYEKIFKGEKNQTIRFPRKNKIKQGDKLYLYTGMRTKYCRKIKDAICISSVPIFISSNYVYIDKVNIIDDFYQLNIFAKNDGFEGWNELVDFFKKEHGLPFAGDLIKWK